MTMTMMMVILYAVDDGILMSLMMLMMLMVTTVRMIVMFRFLPHVRKRIIRVGCQTHIQISQYAWSRVDSISRISICLLRASSSNAPLVDQFRRTVRQACKPSVEGSLVYPP